MEALNSEPYALSTTTHGQAFIEPLQNISYTTFLVTITCHIITAPEKPQKLPEAASKVRAERGLDSSVAAQRLATGAKVKAEVALKKHREVV